ncbi:MAG: adenine phosphoribosyltransferase [Gammaproteobacteria bacterium]
MKRLEEKIRAVQDWPEPGVTFRDLTPLMRDPACMRLAVHQLLQPFLGMELTAVVGMEARGFIFGSLVAAELGVGFVPLRKPGKLPFHTHSADYDLEYGTASLEVHIDALKQGDRVLLVDDLIATGGTAAASATLVETLGAELVGCSFLVELDALGGRKALSGRHVHSVVHF